MKKIVKTIPKQYHYLSEVIDKLPSHVLFNKGITGCGGTTVELQAKRDSIILCPTVSLVKNKEKFGFGIYGSVKTIDILSYINNKSIPYKKIIATYDSLPKLISLIPDYSKYFLLIDEYHLLFNDYSFRMKPIRYILNNYTKFKDWCFMTATPFDKEYKLKELENINTLKYNWEIATPVDIKIYETYFVQKKLLELIDYFINKGRNCHIFINSVKTINALKKHLSYPYRIVCSEYNKKVKNDGINSPVKQVNFYTSCAFEGADIYDKNGVTIVVCDSNISTTMMDISTKMPQICGRLRDSKYKNECYLILNEKRHRYVKTPKEFNDEVLDNVESAKSKEIQFNNESDRDKNTDLKLFGKAPEAFMSLYINSNCENTALLYDANLKDIDRYNYDVFNKIYANSFSVISNLNKNNFQVIEHRCLDKPETKSTPWITIKCGSYTYEQLKDKYESILLADGITWTNRVIKKYFPECKKELKKIKGEVIQMYIF